MPLTHARPAPPPNTLATCLCNATTRRRSNPRLASTGDEAAGTKRIIYFPKTTWYPLDSNKSHPGGESVEPVVPFDQVPVFIRAGTILPLAPVIQHTDDLPGGPLDLQIYPGAIATSPLLKMTARPSPTSPALNATPPSPGMTPPVPSPGPSKATTRARISSRK